MASPSPLSLSAAAILVALTASSLLPPSLSATCTSQTFPTNKLYSFCNDLPSLASSLHYTFDPANSTLSLAFIAAPPSPDGWISWAINPTAAGMVGSQALIAFRDAKGGMVVKTYDIKSYGPLKESKVWYDVKESSAEFSGGVMGLFATIVLPEKGRTAVNQVWQVGKSVTGGVPDKHDFQPGNLNAKGSLNLLKGESNGGGGGGGAGGSSSRSRKRNIHGVLNVVSWGILFPVGIIIARYLKVFPSADPAWFYSHVSCQVSAYAIGVSGWATGIKLGAESKGVTYSVHRNIGIALFCLATVQVFALFLRPKKDHKYRFYWNIYHHGLGYTIIILGIINVFKGFDILQPEKKWRNSYIVVISTLGGIALFLEAVTWIVVLKRKKSDVSTKPYDGFNNGRQEPLAP